MDLQIWLSICEVTWNEVFLENYKKHKILSFSYLYTEVISDFKDLK